MSDGGRPVSEANVRRARLRWGAPPDWVLALAEYADRVGQRRASRRIGYSPSTVNQVLGNRYEGDLEKVAAAVRGALMAETVACPILGEIATHKCLAEQKRGFAATNPVRVALWRACRDGCAYSRLGGRHER